MTRIQTRPPQTQQGIAMLAALDRLPGLIPEIGDQVCLSKATNGYKLNEDTRRFLVGKLENDRRFRVFKHRPGNRVTITREYP